MKLIYDELTAKLFSPVGQENIDTNDFTIRLAEEFALVTYTDMERGQGNGGLHWRRSSKYEECE
jgi:hypothetical protein